MIKISNQGVSPFASAMARLSLAATAGAAAALLTALPAMAADAKAKADTDVGELVVTGVRGAPRTVMDSPTPIDSFNAKDLEQSGRAGVFNALQTLAPSFNLPYRAGGGTSTVIATGGLRGLNPDQTLILVNGKRRHKTSLINIVSSLYNGSVPADLDMVSTAGIQRIDGKSHYVSSGVINAPRYPDTSAPNPLKPGEVRSYRIVAQPIAYVFQPGHRLRFSVAGGATPAPGQRGAQGPGKNAYYSQVTILQDAAHPATMTIPIIGTGQLANLVAASR